MNAAPPDSRHRDLPPGDVAQHLLDRPVQRIPAIVVAVGGAAAFVAAPEAERMLLIGVAASLLARRLPRSAGAGTTPTHAAEVVPAP